MENSSKNFRTTRIGETVFTLFLFFKRDAFGRDYTQVEIDAKKNVKPMPSFDYIETKQGYKITDHKKGLGKFRTRIYKEALAGNIYGGYVRAEKESVVVFTFGRDGKERYIHFPEFTDKGILKSLIKNVTVITTAEKTLPQYTNINSPEKQRYNERMEKYKTMSNSIQNLRKP